MNEVTPIRALDARYYTDPAIFALERERIFFRCWNFVGHVTDVVCRPTVTEPSSGGTSLDDFQSHCTRKKKTC